MLIRNGNDRQYSTLLNLFQ